MIPLICWWFLSTLGKKGNSQLLSTVVLGDIFTITFASLLGCSPSTLTQSFSSPHKPALTAAVHNSTQILLMPLWGNSTSSTVKLLWQQVCCSSSCGRRYLLFITSDHWLWCCTTKIKKRGCCSFCLLEVWFRVVKFFHVLFCVVWLSFPDKSSISVFFSHLQSVASPTYIL